MDKEKEEVKKDKKAYNSQNKRKLMELLRENQFKRKNEDTEKKDE